MSNELREKRVRRMVTRLNKQRKVQAQKIDILCNDLIAAQRQFIHRLNEVAFAAEFYRALAVPEDLHSMLARVAGVIKRAVSEADAAFFLPDDRRVNISIFDCDKSMPTALETLTQTFNADLVAEICSANRLCGLHDMVELGLKDENEWLRTLSGVSIPLSRSGSPVGFILLYRDRQRPIRHEEIMPLLNVIPILARTIEFCRQTTTTDA